MRKRGCRAYWALISAHLDGELDPGEADRLTEHLAICTDCRHVQAQYRICRAHLRHLPPVAPPPELARSIRRATLR